MFFPLKSSLNLNGFPVIVWLLIVINCAIFVYFNLYPYGLLYTDYGFISSKLTVPNEIIGITEKIYPFFSYMFLHNGFFHLFLNMYFLYVFGKNVELYMGTFKFMLAYLLAGVVAIVCDAFINSDNTYPVIGASGAVYGVVGMYLVFFPFTKIKTFIFLILYISTKYIPTILFIVVMFMLELLSFYCFQYLDKYVEEYSFIPQIMNSYFGLTAYIVHLGGFVAGVFIGIVVKFCNTFHSQKEEAEEISIH